MLNERVSEKHTAILFMSMQNRLHCLGICTLTIGICEQTIKKGGSVQSLSRVRLFATPWTAALQCLKLVRQDAPDVEIQSPEEGESSWSALTRKSSDLHLCPLPPSWSVVVDIPLRYKV